MKAALVKANDLIDPLRSIADKFAAPLLDLGFRLYVAQIFFTSGWSRLQSAINGDWGTQLFLFELEHPVPGIAPNIAAILSTSGELILPVLVAFGLFSRFGAAGLIVMALIIQLTYQHNFQHILWIAMMASIFIKGPGVISLDHFLVKWLKKS